MIQYGLNPLGVNKTTGISDLDILKQIRDSNPTSQLPALWMDSEDPYTQWEGVYFGNNSLLDQMGLEIPPIEERLTNKIYLLQNNSGLITDISKVNRLNNLYGLDCGANQLVNLDLTGMSLLKVLYCYTNQLLVLNVSESPLLQWFDCSYNKLTSLSISGLTNLQYFSCKSNKLQSIPTLTSKGNINQYDFTYNNFPTSELNRLRSLGFTDESKLLPQNQ